MFRKIFATLFVGHAGFVEYNNRFTKRDEEFSQQSADDLLMDSLQTGDILVFNRKWFYYHLPTAFMIKMSKVIYGKDSPDHAAVIVQDSLGTPFVYERTPFGGLKIRPYDQRILRSKAQVVSLLPLNPRSELSVIQRNQNRAKIKDELAAYSWKDSELVRFFACSYNYLMNKSSEPVCASAEFVMNTLSNLGVNPSRHCCIEGVTMEDFLEGGVKLESTVYSYDPKDVENYNKVVAPVKQPAKAENNKPKLTMLKVRDHYDVPILPNIAELPEVVASGQKTIKLDISHHVHVRTR